MTEREQAVYKEISQLILDVYRGYNRQGRTAEISDAATEIEAFVAVMQVTHKDTCNQTELWHLIRGSNKPGGFKWFDFKEEDEPDEASGEVERFIRDWFDRRYY